MGDNLRVLKKGDIIPHIPGVRGPLETPDGRGGYPPPSYFRPEPPPLMPLLSLSSLLFSCLYLLFLYFFARLISSLPPKPDPIQCQRRAPLR